MVIKNETNKESRVAGGRDRIRVFRQRDPLLALGTAALFMSQAPPFSEFKLGPWIDTFKGQILRNHYFFSLQNGQVVGYYGWALASHAVARDWIENRRNIAFEECLDGPCVLIMAQRAATRRILAHQARVMRALQADREVAYWKRITPDGMRVVTIDLQAPGVRRAAPDFEIEIFGGG